MPCNLVGARGRFISFSAVIMQHGSSPISIECCMNVGLEQLVSHYAVALILRYESPVEVMVVKAGWRDELLEMRRIQTQLVTEWA